MSPTHHNILHLGIVSMHSGLHTLFLKCGAQNEEELCSSLDVIQIFMRTERYPNHSPLNLCVLENVYF